MAKRKRSRKNCHVVSFDTRHGPVEFVACGLHRRRAAGHAGNTPRKWSGAITSRATFHTPPGLFHGSAKSIAEYFAASAPDLRTAMSRLNFYINRAGKNLSAAARKKLEVAKTHLHAIGMAARERAESYRYEVAQ